MPKALIEGISGADKLCYIDPVKILKNEQEPEFPCEQVLKELLEEVEQFQKRIKNIIKQL